MGGFAFAIDALKGCAASVAVIDETRRLPADRDRGEAVFDVTWLGTVSLCTDASHYCHTSMGTSIH